MGMTEVCDSENRKSYINDLKYYSKYQIVDEVDLFNVGGLQRSSIILSVPVLLLQCEQAC
jgi:hypothetical protein